MSRGRADGSQKKRLVASICVVAIFLGFLYVYGGSIFGSQNSGSSALEYGSRSLKRLGSSYLGADDDTDGKQDESSSNLGQGDGDNDIISKSFPVSCFVSLDVGRIHTISSQNILSIALIFFYYYYFFLAFTIWFDQSLYNNIFLIINNNELSYKVLYSILGCQSLESKYESLVNFNK